MPTDLAPCPCCGGQAELVFEDTYPYSYTWMHIRCRVCDLRTKSASDEILIKSLWNKRP